MKWWNINVLLRILTTRAHAFSLWMSSFGDKKKTKKKPCAHVCAKNPYTHAHTTYLLVFLICLSSIVSCVFPLCFGSLVLLRMLERTPIPPELPLSFSIGWWLTQTVDECIASRMLWYSLRQARIPPRMNTSILIKPNTLWDLPRDFVLDPATSRRLSATKDQFPVRQLCS